MQMFSLLKSTVSFAWNSQSCVNGKCKSNGAHDTLKSPNSQSDQYVADIMKKTFPKGGFGMGF
eukprot:JP448742.1.p3 GENE.JP448742.1~~JP448742.1.p3  ORF type:complete len:63 (+),score=21.85 JP448742.1:21-209(+)